MFDQMKNLKNLAGMLGNAGEMKERFEKLQAELAEKRIDADAGAGAVRVTVNGKFELVNIEIDRAMLTALVGDAAEADKEMVEELILSATNAAIHKAHEVARQEFSRAAGGLNLPGLEGMMGG
ncbi:YbaB/EbfC family nucleoid-associated protein [Phycisphaerales bacterium AB-hyl4]|uniref:Nucleoid-associated protein ACERK3_05455 n=1 Tax=Natronomicrosphaera hydrolytica TaxID=3242702 RepID=A0ABV4U2C9_9BACT